MKTFLFIFLILTFANADANLSLMSKSALVINMSDGNVVYEKNKSDVRAIASITKLMTAIVVIDSNQPLDDLITIEKEDIIATTLSMHETGKSVSVGNIISRKDLIHLALMSSQNRAAAALGRTYPGGMNAFVEAMNNKAVLIGMKDTVFTDPTGLQSTNVSTAADLVKLVQYVSSYSLIKEMSTSQNFQVDQLPDTKFRTTNKLITRPDWDILLQKTGYIHQAGRCMVAIMMVGGNPFAMVLLNSSASVYRVRDALSIKHWILHQTSLSLRELSILEPLPRIKHKIKKLRKYRR
jgi:serine-type D-Ala-D-Ala endopeptidase (penicillin-binding protein 7)